MKTRPGWNETRHAFAWDGSWRDIYVLETTADDWNRLPEAFTAARYDLAFHVNGEPRTPPEDLAAIIAHHDDVHYLALGLSSTVTIDCHFFAIEEIEFSIDPRKIQSEREFESLLSFMELLGTTVKKPVVLTPENESQFALLTFDPETDLWTRTQAAAGGTR